MRMSDWSSDVCSSDLGIDAAGEDTAEEVVGLQRGDQHLERRVEFDGRGRDVANAQVEQRGEEIGRASCRESVCQYVWSAVVAVALKNKTIRYKQNNRVGTAYISHRYNTATSTT